MGIRGSHEPPADVRLSEYASFQYGEGLNGVLAVAPGISLLGLHLLQICVSLHLPTPYLQQSSLHLSPGLPDPTSVLARDPHPTPVYSNRDSSAHVINAQRQC